MSYDTQYSISHFRVDLLVFNRLDEFYPKGEYRPLDETTVCFTREEGALKENWFLSDEDSIYWYAENPEEEE